MQWTKTTFDVTEISWTYIGKHTHLSLGRLPWRSV